MGRSTCTFLCGIRSISISLLILVVVSFLHIRYGIPNECEMTWSQPVFIPIRITQLRQDSVSSSFSTSSCRSSWRTEYIVNNDDDNEHTLPTATHTRGLHQRKRIQDILNTTISSIFSYKYTLYRYSNGFGMLPLLNPFYTTPVLFVPGHSGSYKQVRSLGATMISTIQTESTRAQLKRQNMMVSSVNNHSQLRDPTTETLTKEEEEEQGVQRSSTIDGTDIFPKESTDPVISAESSSSSSSSSSPSTNIVYFTVDFNEESTAIVGHTLLDQAEFVNDAIDAIHLLYYQAYYTICIQSIDDAIRELSSASSSSTSNLFQTTLHHRMSTSIRQQLITLRSDCPVQLPSSSSDPDSTTGSNTQISDIFDKYVPPQTILVGHSMGGFAIRISPLLSNYPRNSVQSFITIATPHSVPPVQIDTFLVKLYAQVNKLWNEVKDNPVENKRSTTGVPITTSSTSSSSSSGNVVSSPPTPPLVDIVKRNNSKLYRNPLPSDRHKYTSSLLSIEQRKHTLYSVLRNISVISISSGETDWQIWEPTTLLDRDMEEIAHQYNTMHLISSSLSSTPRVASNESRSNGSFPPWIWISTLHIPSLRFPIDHLAVLWCGQFIRSLSYALYSLTQACLPQTTTTSILNTNICTPYDRIDSFTNTIMQYTEKVTNPSVDGNHTMVNGNDWASVPRKQYHNEDENIYGVSLFLSLWSWLPFSNLLERYILIGSGINPDLTRMSVAGLLAIVPIRFTSAAVLLGMLVLIVQWLAIILFRLGHINKYYKNIAKNNRESNKNTRTLPSNDDGIQEYIQSFRSSPSLLRDLTYQPWMHLFTMGTVVVVFLQPLGYLGCTKRGQKSASSSSMTKRSSTLCGNVTSQLLLGVTVSTLSYLTYVSFQSFPIGGSWSDTVIPIFPFLFSIFMLYTILPLAFLLTWIIGIILRFLITILHYPFVVVPLTFIKKGIYGFPTTDTKKLSVAFLWIIYGTVIIIPVISIGYAILGYDRLVHYILQPFCTWIYLIYVLGYNGLEHYLFSYGETYSFISMAPFEMSMIREAFTHYPQYLNISSLPGYTNEKNMITNETWKLIQFSLPVQTGAFIAIILFLANIMYLLNIIVRWTDSDNGNSTDSLRTGNVDTNNEIDSIGSSVTVPLTSSSSVHRLSHHRDRSFTDTTDHSFIGNNSTSSSSNGALSKGNHTNLSINTSNVSSVSSSILDTPRSRQRRAESVDATPRITTVKNPNGTSNGSNNNQANNNIISSSNQSSSSTETLPSTPNILISTSTNLPVWVHPSRSLVSYLRFQFSSVISYIMKKPSLSAVSVSTMVGFLYISYIGKIIYMLELFYYPQRTWSGHSTVLFPLPSSSVYPRNAAVDVPPFSNLYAPYASSSIIQDFIASFNVGMSYELYSTIETCILVLLCPVLISTVYIVTLSFDKFYYQFLSLSESAALEVPPSSSGVRLPVLVPHRSRSYLHRLAKVSIIHIYNTVNELMENMNMSPSDDSIKNSAPSESSGDKTKVLPVSALYHNDCLLDECVHESGGKDAIYEETTASIWKPFVYYHSNSLNGGTSSSATKSVKKSKSVVYSAGTNSIETIYLGPTFKVVQCNCWNSLPQVLTRAAIHEPTLADCGWGSNATTGYGGLSTFRSPSSDDSQPNYPTSWSAYDVHRLYNTSPSIIRLFLCKYCTCTCTTCGGSNLGSYFLRRPEIHDDTDSRDENDDDDALSIDSANDDESSSNANDHTSSSSIDDIDTPSDMDAKQRLLWLRTQRLKQKQQKAEVKKHAFTCGSTIWRSIKYIYVSSVWLSFLPFRLPLIILRLLWQSIGYPDTSTNILSGTINSRLPSPPPPNDVRRIKYFINALSSYIIVSIGSIFYYIYLYGTMNASHMGNSALLYVPCLYVLSLFDYYGLLP